MLMRLSGINQMKKISVLPERKRKCSVIMQPSCMQICNLHATFMYVIVPFRRFFALNASLVCIWFKLSASICQDYKKVERKLGLLAHKFWNMLNQDGSLWLHFYWKLLNKLMVLNSTSFLMSQENKIFWPKFTFLLQLQIYSTNFMCCFERIIR